MGAMFLAMVGMPSAGAAPMEDLRRVSEPTCGCSAASQFIRTLARARTPITVAIGHASCVERASSEPERARTPHRGRRAAHCCRGRPLFSLATSEDPDSCRGRRCRSSRSWADNLAAMGPTPRSWRLDRRSRHRGRRRRQSRDALDALVENAVKHTGPGDEIRWAPSGRATWWPWCGRRRHRLPADQLEGIFERFAGSTGRAAADLAGSVLAWRSCRRFAGAHGGTVAVESTPSRGRSSSACCRSSAPTRSTFRLGRPGRRLQGDRCTASCCRRRRAVAVRTVTLALHGRTVTNTKCSRSRRLDE